MMFFPYGPGVNLINHNSQNPNVYMRWSTNHMHHSQWLSLPPKQMFQMIYPGGLMLEVVALRDIASDEELFMDYGMDWEKAWNKHVQEWKPLPDPDKYVYPGDMDMTKPFRTVKEQETDPYPNNLLTVCSTGNGHRDGEPRKRKWKRYVQRLSALLQCSFQLLSNYFAVVSSTLSHVTLSYVSVYSYQYDWPEGLVHCFIMDRVKVKDEELYTVMLDLHGDRDYDPSIPMKERYIDRKVPKSAIGFTDKPYTSDLHLSNAFRQPIGFPDHLVPELWRTAARTLNY
jgi:hypothetical protein